MAFTQSWRAALKLSHVLDIVTSGVLPEDTKYAMRFGHIAWVMLSDINEKEADPNGYAEVMWDRQEAGMSTPSFSDAAVNALARGFIDPGRNDIGHHAEEMDGLMVPKLKRAGWPEAQSFSFVGMDAKDINAAFAVAFAGGDAPWWIQGVSMCIERYGDITMAELAHPDPVGEMNAAWRAHIGEAVAA